MEFFASLTDVQWTGLILLVIAILWLVGSIARELGGRR